MASGGSSSWPFASRGRRRDDDPLDLHDRTEVADVLLNGGLLPVGSRLEPEDAGGDRLGAVAHRLPVEALGDAAVGLDAAGVEFVPVVLAEGLGVDAEDTGDVGLRHAIGGHRLDLAAADRFGLMCLASHRAGLSQVSPAPLPAGGASAGTEGSGSFGVLSPGVCQLITIFGGATREFGDLGLLPAGPGLHPEDRGDDRLTTVSRRLAEQVLRDLGVGLDVAVLRVPRDSASGASSDRCR